MKRHNFIILPVLLLFLISCSESKKSNSNAFGITELSLRQSATGSISTIGEVDWYHYRANEANNILQVKCTSNTYRADVDFLVTAFKLDENGDKVRVYADHAPENSQLPANINMYIYINAPKDLYFSVRDLLDDEASNNKYFLRLDYAGGLDGNDNFAQAQSLIVDDRNNPVTDSIEFIGDVDSYKFVISTNGVYSVAIDFHSFGNTQVKLCVDLYNSSGVLIGSSQGQVNNYSLLPYLKIGEYYVLIYDSGRDDFDNSSTYDIGINSVNVDESFENDTIAAATSVSFDSPMNINGSLDYLGDKDWYAVPLSNNSGLKIVNLTVSTEDINFIYQIHLLDSTDNILMTHRKSGGSSAYQAQIKAGQGNTHYLLVEPAEDQVVAQSASYSVSVLIEKINDPNDIDGKGNDPASAVQLAKDIFTANTYIAYRGDEDWYRLEVPAKSPAQRQILEVYLDNNEASSVEYSLSIIQGAVIKRAFDSNGSDGASSLKISLLVPPSNESITYYFRVCDYQNNDGDANTPYRIKANYKSIPTLKSELPADVLRDDINTQYYDEVNEADIAEAITLQTYTISETEYKVNTALLDFHAAVLPPGVTITDDELIEFPWIAGYIDYQGDNDFFELNLGPLIPEDTEWYYEIEIKMHVNNPGSEVEYIWQLYRDSNQDGILVGRPSSASCVFANDGDVTPTVKEGFDINSTDSSPDGLFWVGSLWADNSPIFYIGISDFNYIANHPDDDWGYDMPYYFQLSLTYHSGHAAPLPE